MKLSKFLGKQEKIYSELKDVSELLIEGVKPNIVEGKGGYGIAFRYSKECVDFFSEVSRRVCDFVPAMCYDENNFHTTISFLGSCDNFMVDEKFLEKLACCLEGVDFSSYSIYVDFKELLVNQDSVIAAGYPNEDFHNLVCEVLGQVRKKGIVSRDPWGAHMTVNRFLEKTDLLKVRQMADFVKSVDIDLRAVPIAVDVGYGVFCSGEFRFSTYKRFLLK